MELAKAGLVVGFLGDIGLQLANKLGFGNDGLKTYFSEHGPPLSALKASILTGFWSGLFELVIPGAYQSLSSFALWAALVDLLYRKFHPTIYPTLEGYYKENGTISTIFYNVITAVLVWGLGEKNKF